MKKNTMQQIMSITNQSFELCQVLAGFAIHKCAFRPHCTQNATSPLSDIRGIPGLPDRCAGLLPPIPIRRSPPVQPIAVKDSVLEALGALSKPKGVAACA